MKNVIDNIWYSKLSLDSNNNTCYRHHYIHEEVQESMPEANLVYNSMSYMDRSMRVFLGRANITTFAESIDKAQKTTLLMHKANRKIKRL